MSAVAPPEPSPCPCQHRTSDDLGPCPRCGSIAIPFLGGYFNVAPTPPEAPHEPPLRRRRLRPREPLECVPPVLPTVPWDPDAEGHIRGKTVRAVRLAAELALERGWSAAELRARANWAEDSIAAACVRIAVRWGQIP